MKIIKYTLNEDGTIPKGIIDGGYFPKFNGGKSPQDYDLIGYSEDFIGKEEFPTKTDFDNYVKSLSIDDNLEVRGKTIQKTIDDNWTKSKEIIKDDSTIKGD